MAYRVDLSVPQMWKSMARKDQKYGSVESKETNKLFAKWKEEALQLSEEEREADRTAFEEIEPGVYTQEYVNTDGESLSLSLRRQPMIVMGDPWQVRRNNTPNPYSPNPNDWNQPLNPIYQRRGLLERYTEEELKIAREASDTLFNSAFEFSTVGVARVYWENQWQAIVSFSVSLNKVYKNPAVGGEEFQDYLQRQFKLNPQDIYVSEFGTSWQWGQNCHVWRCEVKVISNKLIKAGKEELHPLHFWTNLRKGKMKVVYSGEMWQ